MAGNVTIPTLGEIIKLTDLNNYVSSDKLNSTIGNINTILDDINGEVV